MLYPREINAQEQIIKNWRRRVIDLGRSSQPLRLGFRSGTDYLVGYLKTLEAIGVNHVALNLRFNQKNIEMTLHQIAEKVLPEFSAHQQLFDDRRMVRSR